MKLNVAGTELRLYPTGSDSIWLVENLSDLSAEAFVQAPDALQLLDDDGNIVKELVKNRIMLVFEHNSRQGWLVYGND